MSSNKFFDALKNSAEQPDVDMSQQDRYFALPRNEAELETAIKIMELIVRERALRSDLRHIRIQFGAIDGEYLQDFVWKRVWKRDDDDYHEY